MSLFSARTLSPKVVLLDGFNHQEIHTRGLRLHAAVAGSPSDPCIVLLHDAYGSWMDFRRLLPLLASKGYHVIALDLRGYGYSDKPPQGYDLRHLNGDVSGVIRTMGHDSAHVVGVGAGAAIAWTMPTSHPEHISGITCIDGIHPVDMRRLTLTRPWLFSQTIENVLFAHLPSLPRRQLWKRRDRWLGRELRAGTSLAYQEGAHFAEDLRLRIMAMSVESTQAAVARTVKIATTLPPAKWLGNKVTVPVQFVGDKTSHSQVLAARARARCLGEFEYAVIDGDEGSRWRAHLEAPEKLAELIAGFVGTH